MKGYAMNTNCGEKPNAIIDVDCHYDAGKFILARLPGCLPTLCTVRFIAPADYVQGDTIIVKGGELAVRTPGMSAAGSDMFKTGAVVHCDIDLDRSLAFFWLGAGSQGTVLPNISESEQFAGFYDLDNQKVYVKTIVLEVFSAADAATTKVYEHNIPSIKSIIQGHLRLMTNSVDCRTYLDNHANIGSGAWNLVVYERERIYLYFRRAGDYANYEARVTLYYTCTDR